MSEFYFDVGKWEEDLARRGGRLMGEEDLTGEEGTKEKKRKRPSKKDLVCRFTPFFFPLFSLAFIIPFFFFNNLRRIGLKNKKDSRKSLKQLGCALEFFFLIALHIYT